MLNNATTTLVRHRLSTEIFTSWILDRYVARGHMRIFLDVMITLVKSDDINIDTMQIYLRSACEWLEKRRFYTWLHRLQSSTLLIDHYGAARTCERLYAEANSFDRRVGHLEQAREHYAMSMRESVSTRSSKLSLELLETMQSVEQSVEQSTEFVNTRNTNTKAFTEQKGKEQNKDQTATASMAQEYETRDAHQQEEQFEQFEQLIGQDTAKASSFSSVPDHMKSALLSKSPSAFSKINKSGTKTEKLQKSKSQKSRSTSPPLSPSASMTKSPPKSPPKSIPKSIPTFNTSSTSSISSVSSTLSTSTVRKQLLVSKDMLLHQRKMRLINVLNDRAIENRIEQVQAQLEVMHLVPWDLSHQLIILDVEGIDLKLKTLQQNDKDTNGTNGMEDNTKYTILQEKRIFLTGQCVLFGHTRIGHRLARSFGLNLKACTASTIYRILKEPTCWTLAQTMGKYLSEGAAREWKHCSYRHSDFYDLITL